MGSFYEDEEAKETKLDKALDKISGGRAESLLTGITTVVSIALAVGIFILLPYFLSSILARYVRNTSLLSIIEGGIRILIFLAYVVGISLMKDIYRLYQYHGAEHKCISCVEKGRPLTVHNVMRSSRIHRRCGTSFMVFVIFVSIILFFFIRVENPVYRILLRVALIPGSAGKQQQWHCPHDFRAGPAFAGPHNQGAGPGHGGGRHEGCGGCL